MSDTDTPEFYDDDPAARVDPKAAPTVPETSFAQISDAAIDHAASTARRDVQSDTLIWTPIGPRNVGGRLRAIVQDPTDPRILYAGSGQGGLWKTEDGGDIWRPMANLLRDSAETPATELKDTAAPIGAIGLCERDSRHLYVGTGEPVANFFAGYGLFYSDNAGARFRRIAPPASAAAGQPIRADRFERILVDPWQPKRAWIAAPTGLWRCGPGATANDPPRFPANADAIDAAPVAGNPQDVTDIAIDFGNRANAAPPATYTVFAAVRGQGVFRATFDTATANYRATGGVVWTRLGAAAAGGFVALPTIPAAQQDGRRGRFKLALCAGQPAHVYAIMGQGLPTDGTPSAVFHSSDGGNRWTRRTVGAGSPGSNSSIGWYALVMEVHPTDPAIIVAGSVELARSINNGTAWTRIMDGTAYDRGDRAQHADQHAVLFDRADPTVIWACNDGGISRAPILNRTNTGVFTAIAAPVWRKRSHGILAAQFYDITVHPTFPFIHGGGLQDNGTWVSFGGGTWHYMDSGDGGAIGFEPNDPQRFLTIWQGGLDRATIRSGPAGTVGNAALAVNPVPDAQALNQRVMLVATAPVAANFTNADTSFIGARIEALPGVVNGWIMARNNRPYLSRNGTTFNPLNVPASIAGAPVVTAIGIAASDAANTWWIGTDNGDIFRTTNAGAAWTAVQAAPVPTRRIADIAVHPANTNIVALAVDDRANQVFLSSDAGATWFDISSRATPADAIAPSPATSIRFDPSAGAALTDPQTLYVGTAAGVYIARGVVPRAGPAVAPRAAWRTLNNGMPLVLVQDLAFAEYRDAANVVVRRALRAATFGRGIYELDLGGPPAVRLLTRSTVIEDGHPRAGVANLTFDPRLLGPAATPRVPFTAHNGFDLRADAPVSFDTGLTMDGAEFDEQLVPSLLRRGDVNLIYMQVQNTGHRTIDNVRVSLYFARLSGPNQNAPDLDADFWTTYPAPPAPDRVWQRAGEVVVQALGPANPRVARFVWNAPLDLSRDVALLGIVSHADDPVTVAIPTLQVDPRAHGNAALVLGSRHAVMRIVTSQGGLFLRDGGDDTGEFGAVAWGARSHDIVIRQAAEANPDTAFASPTDRRLGDVLRGGQANHIFVRVTNRQAAQVQARVRLLRAVFPNFARAADWQQIGTDVTVTVPANSTRFTRPGLVFNVPADPAPGQSYKAILLLVLIGTDNDPLPDHTQMANLSDFWRLTVTNSDSNNVACRAIRVS